MLFSVLSAGLNIAGINSADSDIKYLYKLRKALDFIILYNMKQHHCADISIIAGIMVREANAECVRKSVKLMTFKLGIGFL